MYSLYVVLAIIVSFHVLTSSSIPMGYTTPIVGPASLSSSSSPSSHLRAPDPCAFTYNNAYYLSSILNCFDNVPFSSSIANQTITTLLAAMQFYSYTPILRGPPSPYNTITVDLLQQLSNLRSTSFSTDWDFQKSIIKLFISLRDAHTLYTPPNPYTYATLYRPFFIGYSSSPSGSLSYTLDYVVAYTSLIYKDLFFGSGSSMNLSSLLGSKLVAINGQPADQWMENYSARFYYSKDSYANLNYVIKSAFGACNMYQEPTSIDNVVGMETWTILNNNGSIKNYSFPLIAVWFGVSVLDTDGFLTDYYKSSAQPKKDQQPNKKMILEPSTLHPNTETLAVYEPTPKWMEPYLQPLLPRDPQQQQPQQQQTRQATGFTNPSFQIIQTLYFDPPNQNSIIASYGILNGAVPTAVLRINSFSMSTASERSGFVNLLVSTLNDASTSRGISHLIIDVLDNGGGIVCLSQLLNNIYTTNWIYDPTAYNSPMDGWYSNDFISYPFLLLGNFTYINASYIVDDWRTDVPYVNSDLSWASGSGKQLDVVRGSAATKADYTGQVGIYCSSYWRTFQGIPKGWFDGSVDPPYFEKIIVLTDGTCGSACCQMSMRFQESGKAKVAMWGGAQGVSVDTGSFCGGAVKNWGDIYRNTVKPVNFVTTASVTINNLEVFTKSDLNIPREWKRLSPDYRVHADGVSQGGASYNIMHGATYNTQSAFDDYVNLLIRTSELFGDFTGNNIPSPHSSSQSPTSSASAISPPSWVEPFNFLK